MSTPKKILKIELWKVEGEILALVVGFNPGSSAKKMAEQFTEAIFALVKSGDKRASTIMTVLVSAVENVKMEFPLVDAGIRKQKIDHIKKQRENGE